MRKFTYLILAVGLLLAALRANAQDGIPISQVTRSGTPDQQNWTGYFTSVLSMFGTDGKSGLQFNPNVYAFTHLSKYAHGDTLVMGDTYQRQWYLRNLQFNIGLTPDGKNQLDIDAFNYGLKFAVLNNKFFNKNEIGYFDDLVTKNIIPAISFLEKWKFANPSENAVLTAFAQNQNHLKLSQTPPDFQKAFLQQFHIASIDSAESIFFDPEAAYEQLVKMLKTKPSLTVSATQTYNSLKSQFSSDVFSATGTFYLNTEKGRKVDTLIEYTATASFTLGADTLLTHSSLVRRITEVTAGPDFSFKSKKMSWLQLQADADFVNTEGPRYKKENEYTLNASLTPRIRVNKNFTLPITLKYNPLQSNQRLLGQFSIQYSLK